MTYNIGRRFEVIVHDSGAITANGIEAALWREFPESGVAVTFCELLPDKSLDTAAFDVVG